MTTVNIINISCWHACTCDLVCTAIDIAQAPTWLRIRSDYARLLLRTHLVSAIMLSWQLWETDHCVERSRV